MSSSCLKKSPASQAGFTLMEVLVALVVFVISVVGLVSMQGRTMEAQKAAVEIRGAERIAQNAMAELQSQGFLDLLSRNFAGAPNPMLPYDDSGLAAATRTRPLVRNFTPDANGDPLGVPDNFVVFRTVNVMTDPNAVPTVSNPPVLPPATPDDMQWIWALELQVTVLWVDRTNPAFPPPANAKASMLTLDMIDPLSADYEPYVSHVQLRTVRVNDVLMPDPTAGGGTGP